MEKISGIIPPSARMKLVETSAAQPARPGAPEMGRIQGKNSMGDRITLSKQMEEMRASGELPTPKPLPAYKNSEANKLKTIEDINKKFFSSPGQAAADKAEIMDGESVLSERVFNKTSDNDSFSSSPTDLKESRSSLEN